jgi:hypothetical protein
MMIKPASNAPFLEQAQFLSHFQYFYGLKDNLGPITPKELENVYQLRSRKEKHEKLQDDAFLFELHNKKHTGRALENPYEEDLNESEQIMKYAEKDERLCRLDALVEKFEVWSTKGKSNCEAMKHCEAKKHHMHMHMHSTSFVVDFHTSMRLSGDASSSERCDYRHVLCRCCFRGRI